MIKNKSIGFGIVIVLLTFIVSYFVLFGNDEKDVADENLQLQQKTKVMELDYANIDTVVSEVLKEEPIVAKEIEEIRKISATENGVEKLLKDRSVQDAFDVQKTKFRLKVENQLLDQTEYSDEVFLDHAKKHNNNYLEALEKAEKEYGVTVSQEEVTKYISQNVAAVHTEEKEKYAKALGITLSELDYLFDRDFYVMDVLWEKLTPALMDAYSQQDGENSKDYYERMEKAFYNH